MDAVNRVNGLVVVAYDSDTCRFIGVINECSFPFPIREAILHSAVPLAPGFKFPGVQRIRITATSALGAGGHAK